jgi:hypothetical protein
MIYTLDLCRGSQVFNAGTGGPSLWVGLDDPIGTFRIGIPGGVHFVTQVYPLGIDDAWHELGGQDPFNDEAWWVRHVSWTRVEVEYRS